MVGNDATSVGEVLVGLRGDGAGRKRYVHQLIKDEFVTRNKCCALVHVRPISS
jgi:hypothetical protein